MVHPVGAAIPIAGVAEVTFDLVQHGVAFCSLDLRENSHANQRKRFLIHGGGAVFVLLDDLMRGVPFAGQSQFHRLE